MNFKYSHRLKDFNMELDCKDNILMGENNVFNKLVVMDYISGLAEKSDHFANFLTVSSKFYFTCLCFSYDLPYQKQLADDPFTEKIFNIFPGSLQTFSMIKTLLSYCNRYTYEYIPHRDFWLNRFYFDN